MTYINIVRLFTIAILAGILMLAPACSTMGKVVTGYYPIKENPEPLEEAKEQCRDLIGALNSVAHPKSFGSCMKKRGWMKCPAIIPAHQSGTLKHCKWGLRYW